MKSGWSWAAAALLMVLVFTANARWQEAQNAHVAAFRALVDTLYATRYAALMNAERAEIIDSIMHAPICIHPADEFAWAAPPLNDDTTDLETLP